MAPLVFLILVMSTFGVFASASSSSVAGEYLCGLTKEYPY